MTPRLRIILLGSALLWLAGCADKPGSPEQQIAAYVAAAETAAEARSVDGLRELIATDYVDESGRKRLAILRLMQAYFLGHQHIHLLTRIQEIDFPEPGVANVVVLAGMTGQPVHDLDMLLQQRAELMRFDLYLVLDGDEWLLQRALWRRARIEDFFD